MNLQATVVVQGSMRDWFPEMADGMARLLRAAALAAMALLAATPAVGQHRAGGPMLSFTVTDSSLRGPATVAAGVVTIQLANRGRGVHELQLLELQGGHTPEEAKNFLIANEGWPPWSRFAIGVGPVPVGASLTAIVKLDPGTYLLIDRLPDARGEANFRAGVTAPFTVTGNMIRDLANVPAIAGLMLTSRFRFGNLVRSGNTWTQSETRDRNTTVRAGLQTIRFESSLGGLHSVVLARGGPEVMQQYANWRAGRRPNPPAGLIGGIASLSGQMFRNRAFLQVQLTPGGYILFCPEPDPRGVMDFDTGEFTQFAVR